MLCVGHSLSADGGLLWHICMHYCSIFNNTKTFSLFQLICVADSKDLMGVAGEDNAVFLSNALSDIFHTLSQ